MYLLLLPKYHYYNTPRQENKSFKVFIFSFTICSSFDIQSFLFSPLQYTVRLIFRVCHSLKFPTVRRQGLSDHVHREILRLPKPCHLFSLLHPHPHKKKKKKKVRYKKCIKNSLYILIVGSTPNHYTMCSFP
jgi:hypothetical protein